MSDLGHINKVLNSGHYIKFTPDKPLMTAIAEHMLASVHNNFETEGEAVQPGGWQELKKKTILQKIRNNSASQILQAKGNLLRSIQSSSTNDTAAVHTNLRYAKIHNDGGTITIPARTRTLLHRTDSKGNLLRQSKNKNLLVLASRRHKNVSAYTFGQNEYTITMPARPYMVLTDPYEILIADEIKKRITN